MPSGVFSVVDLETTGFLARGNDRIVEIGIVTVDRDGQILDRWETLLNPDRDLGPQHIHRIAARDVWRAPRLEDLAEELSHRLSGTVVVAHNLAFDGPFLEAQLGRVGSGLPAGYLDLGICTMRSAPRFVQGIGRSLAECCEVFGVTNLHAHCAGDDAYATAQLLSRMIEIDPAWQLWDERLSLARDLDWAPVPPAARAQTVLRRREDEHEDHYLERIVTQLPSADGGPEENDYLALLDRALLDGVLSASESDALVELAGERGIDKDRALRLNRRYFTELVAIAWDDGIVTDAERDQIVGAARLLGLTAAEAESAVNAPPAPVGAESSASETIDASPAVGRFSVPPGSLIVLTGDMSRPRSVIAADLERAGFIVHGGVTKKVALVVAADPDSLSGKAKKARDYGLPVVGENYLSVLLG